jgi:hypothetical protein
VGHEGSRHAGYQIPAQDTGWPFVEVIGMELVHYGSGEALGMCFGGSFRDSGLFIHLNMGMDC